MQSAGHGLVGVVSQPAGSVNFQEDIGDEVHSKSTPSDTLSDASSTATKKRCRTAASGNAETAESVPPLPRTATPSRCMVRVAGRSLCLRTLHKLVRKLGGNSLLCSSSRAETYSSLFKQLPVPPGKLGSKSAPGRIRKAYRELLAPLVELCGGIHAPDWNMEVSAALRVDVAMHLFQREWSRWVQTLRTETSTSRELQMLHKFLDAVLQSGEALMDCDIRNLQGEYSPSRLTHPGSGLLPDDGEADPRSVVDMLVTPWIWKCLQRGGAGVLPERWRDAGAADEISAAEALRNVHMVELAEQRSSVHPGSSERAIRAFGDVQLDQELCKSIVDSMPKSLLQAPLLLFVLHAVGAAQSSSSANGPIPQGASRACQQFTDKKASQSAADTATWMSTAEKVGVVRLTVRHAKHSLGALIPQLPPWTAQASLDQIRSAWIQQDIPAPRISATGANNSSNTLSAVETKYAWEPRDLPQFASAWRFRALWAMAQELVSAHPACKSEVSLALPPDFDVLHAISKMGERSTPGTPHVDVLLPGGRMETDPSCSQSGSDPANCSTAILQAVPSFAEAGQTGYGVLLQPQLRQSAAQIHGQFSAAQSAQAPWAAMATPGMAAHAGPAAGVSHLWGQASAQHQNVWYGPGSPGTIAPAAVHSGPAVSDWNPPQAANVPAFQPYFVDARQQYAAGAAAWERPQLYTRAVVLVPQHPQVAPPGHAIYPAPYQHQPYVYSDGGQAFYNTQAGGAHVASPPGQQAGRPLQPTGPVPCTALSPEQNAAHAAAAAQWAGWSRVGHVPPQVGVGAHARLGQQPQRHGIGAYAGAAPQSIPHVVNSRHHQYPQLYGSGQHERRAATMLPQDLSQTAFKQPHVTIKPSQQVYFPQSQCGPTQLTALGVQAAQNPTVQPAAGKHAAAAPAAAGPATAAAVEGARTAIAAFAL